MPLLEFLRNHPFSTHSVVPQEFIRLMTLGHSHGKASKESRPVPREPKAIRASSTRLTFEELHGAFVVFGGFKRCERAEISAFARLRVWFT